MQTLQVEDFFEDVLEKSVKYLFISLETDGVGAFFSQTVVRVALVLTDASMQPLSLESFFVKGATCLAYNPNSYTLHQLNNGLTQEDAATWITSRVNKVVANSGVLVAHNFNFVDHILFGLGVNLIDYNATMVCTMHKGAPLCKLLPYVRGQYKYPQLSQLYKYLFPESSESVGHRAEEKAWVLKVCYTQMKNKNIL
jgi:hypothetical protein